MELKLDEQTLLACFHRLSSEGKKELLDYAVFLNNKQSSDQHPEETLADNQCKLASEPKGKTEAAKEPIFTE